MPGQLIPAINTCHAFTAGCHLNLCLCQPRILYWISPISEGEGGRVKNPNWLSGIRVCVCLRSYWYFLLSLKLQFMLENPIEQRMAYCWVGCKNYIIFRSPSLWLCDAKVRIERHKDLCYRRNAPISCDEFLIACKKNDLLSTKVFSPYLMSEGRKPPTSPQWGIPQCPW